MAVAIKNDFAMDFTWWFVDHSREHSRRIHIVVAAIFLSLAVTALFYLPPGSRPFVAILFLGVASLAMMVALSRMRFFYNFAIDFYFSKNLLEKYKGDLEGQFKLDASRTYYHFDDHKAFHEACQKRFETSVQSPQLERVISYMHESRTDPLTFDKALAQDHAMVEEETIKKIYREERAQAIIKHCSKFGNIKTLYPFIMQGVVADFVYKPLQRVMFKDSEDFVYRQMAAKTETSSMGTAIRMYHNKRKELCIEVVQRFEKSDMNQDGQAHRYYIATANVNLVTCHVRIDGEKLLHPPQHISQYLFYDTKDH